MPRPLRVEDAGAIYHLMNRGDRREPIFLDDQDRRIFLRMLLEACRKTRWQIHACCLMNNHLHLVAETPQPNLVASTKWLLGTYTGRFNRRHQYFGHVFSGRYKSLFIDERSPGYLPEGGVRLRPFEPGPGGSGGGGAIAVGIPMEQLPAVPVATPASSVAAGGSSAGRTWHAGGLDGGSG